jgi:hypothetical protein
MSSNLFNLNFKQTKLSFIIQIYTVDVIVNSTTNLDKSIEWTECETSNTIKWWIDWWHSLVFESTHQLNVISWKWRVNASYSNHRIFIILDNNKEEMSSLLLNEFATFSKFQSYFLNWKRPNIVNKMRKETDFKVYSLLNNIMEKKKTKTCVVYQFHFIVPTLHKSFQSSFNLCVWCVFQIKEQQWKQKTE